MGGKLCLKKILLAISLLTITVSTFADWVDFDKDSEKTYYSDPARWIVKDRNNQIATVWIKSVIHTDLTKDGYGVGDHQLVQFSINCQEQTNAMVSVFAYKKGSLDNSYTEKYLKYEPLIPDSRGELVASVACASLFDDAESV